MAGRREKILNRDLPSAVKVKRATEKLSVYIELIRKKGRNGRLTNG